MAKFHIKLRGVFSKTVEVEAKTAEEAEEMASSNLGTDIEESLTGWCEIDDIEQVD